MVHPGTQDAKPLPWDPVSVAGREAARLSLPPAPWGERTREGSGGSRLLGGDSGPVRAPLLQEGFGPGRLAQPGTGVACLPGAELCVHQVPGLQAQRWAVPLTPEGAPVTRQHRRRGGWAGTATQRESHRTERVLTERDARVSAAALMSRTGLLGASTRSPCPGGPQRWPLGLWGHMGHMLCSLGLSS